MSKHTNARGTRCSPSSRCNSYTGSAARSSVSDAASRNSSSRCRAFCWANSISSRFGPRRRHQPRVPGIDSSQRLPVLEVERNEQLARPLGGSTYVPRQIGRQAAASVSSSTFSSRRWSRASTYRRGCGRSRRTHHRRPARTRRHRDPRLPPRARPLAPRAPRVGSASRNSAARSKSSRFAAASIRARTADDIPVRPSRISMTSSIIAAYSACVCARIHGALHRLM